MPMRPRRMLEGFLVAVVMGAVVGGAIYLVQRFTCSRLPDMPLLNWGCDSSPTVMAVVIGITAGLISLVGWSQSRR